MPIMPRRVSMVLTPFLLVLGSTVAAVNTAESPFLVEEFGDAKIYRVPFYSGVQTDTIPLFPHPKPLKKQAGWTMAYLDNGYKLSNPLFLEEVPAGRPEVLAELMLAEITYVVVSGEGVSIHQDASGVKTASVIREGDIFFVPYGHWIGFGNPSTASLRILGSGTAFVPAILDQDIAMVDEDGLRTKVPFVVEYLKLLSGADATSFGMVTKDARSSTRPSAEKKGAITVYEPGWAAPVDTLSTEVPPHHYPKRQAEGWRDAHIETGGRIQNNMFIQEAAPSFKEIGHRHSGGAMFYGLKGDGYMAFRGEKDAPERRLFWKPKTLFNLPPYPNEGLWHAHANTSDERNRLLAINFFLDKRIVDAYTGRTTKDYDDNADRDGVWDAIKKPGSK